MNPHFSRAQLLFEQGRWELAEQELRQALAQQPDLPAAHALLALSLVERQKFSEAQAEAERAVGQAPDFSFGHYALARVLSSRNETEKALSAISEALRLDPADADYHAVQAGLLFDRRRWPEALQAAEAALQLDSEHIAANNLRAMALVKLGRKAEAGATLEATLARNPDNASTHANRGWALLDQGERKQALEHFREALRLDPMNDWARAGIVEALQAGNPLYALMLRYFLWMQRLSANAQWALILGAWLGNRMLGTFAESNPALAPWVAPLQFLYLAFVLLTWLAQPLFNLLLRLNRFGRYALSEDQIQGANWVGGCLAAGLLATIGGALTEFPPGSGVTILVCFALSLPVAGIFKCSPGWPRQVMAGGTLLLATIGLAAAALSPLVPKATGALLGLFALGFIISLFGANFLATRRPRR